MDWAGATEEYSGPGPRWRVEVGPTGREGSREGSQPERPTLLLSLTKEVLRDDGFPGGLCRKQASSPVTRRGHGPLPGDGPSADGGAIRCTGSPEPEFIHASNNSK